MINKENLDEMLEYAIAEEGARAHLQEYERRKRLAFNRRIRTISYSAAACLALMACTTGYLGIDARKVGYGYEPPSGIKGASEIEALMEERDNKTAILKIEEKQQRLAEEKENPMYDDPVYLEDLNAQEQELAFLKAVCQLRRGRFFTARKALKAIVSEGGIYADRAQELIDKL
jgi:hypothetical protein